MPSGRDRMKGGRVDRDRAPTAPERAVPEPKHLVTGNRVGARTLRRRASTAGPAAMAADAWAVAIGSIDSERDESTRGCCRSR